MYCRQCGTKLDDNAKFCGYCGTPVEQRKATEAVAAPITEPPAWEEPVSEVEWEAPTSEEIWSDTAQQPNWKESTVGNETWSDTWSETAQTSGWNLQQVNEVPLIIEPKKKSVGLTILTIIGSVALAALLVVCAILMNGGGNGNSYVDIWYSDSQVDYEEVSAEYEENWETELEDRLFL